VLEAAGLIVQLDGASQANRPPGRPKTDKADAMWLARLTEMGLLRASFVPPKADHLGFCVPVRPPGAWRPGTHSPGHHVRLE
jgi:hypothetical protein